MPNHCTIFDNIALAKSRSSQQRLRLILETLATEKLVIDDTGDWKGHQH